MRVLASLSFIWVLTGVACSGSSESDIQTAMNDYEAAVEGFFKSVEEAVDSGGDVASAGKQAVDAHAEKIKAAGKSMVMAAGEDSANYAAERMAALSKKQEELLKALQVKLNEAEDNDAIQAINEQIQRINMIFSEGQLAKADEMTGGMAGAAAESAKSQAVKMQLEMAVEMAGTVADIPEAARDQAIESMLEAAKQSGATESQLDEAREAIRAANGW